MRILVVCVCIILGACSCLRAQGIGRSEPPYVEAAVTMPTRLMKNAEKRCDMVSELAEKSEMNYRLLAMKVMEKWQASLKGDKDFLKNLMKYKTVSFAVRKDGSIVIKGVEDPPPADKKATGGKKNSARPAPVSATDNSAN